MPPVWQHTRSSHICKSMFLSVNAVCNAVYKRTFVHSIQASFELVSENLLLVATRYGMIRFFSHSVYVFSKHAPDVGAARIACTVRFVGYHGFFKRSSGCRV
jgi:hypothetical protein